MQFLISNFRRVLNDICFLLGDSPASEFYMPTFRNTLSMCSETSAYKIQAPRNYPEESMQHVIQCYTEYEGIWLYVTLSYGIKESDITLQHDLNMIGS